MKQKSMTRTPKKQTFKTTCESNQMSDLTHKEFIMNMSKVVIMNMFKEIKIMINRRSYEDNVV